MKGDAHLPDSELDIMLEASLSVEALTTSIWMARLWEITST